MCVLKKVHPEMKISKRAMRLMNAFVNDMFERISSEAGKCAQYSGSSFIGVRDVQAATSLILPGELAKHALTSGNRSMTKYMASMK